MNKRALILIAAVFLLACAVKCAYAEETSVESDWGGLIYTLPGDAYDSQVVIPEYDFSSAIALLESVLNHKEASVSTADLKAYLEAIKTEIASRDDMKKAIAILRNKECPK